MIRSKLLPSVWEIPPYFHNRLGDRAGRQRAMVDNGHLLLVLHQPPQLNSKHREPQLFYRKPDGTWHSNADGSGLAALGKHLERFDRLLETLEIQEDQAKTANEYRSLIEEMLPLKRMAANLHATLDEARKGLPQVRELINFRDHAYEISRAADLLFEAIKAGAELAQTRMAEAQARHAHGMAQSAHRLNLLVAFFFPLATMAAVFGMNLQFGLEEIKGPQPFLIVCLCGVVLGILLLGSIIKRPRETGHDD
jgi:Mg2+ and Co2+ transporter CorA